MLIGRNIAIILPLKNVYIAQRQYESGLYFSAENKKLFIWVKRFKGHTTVDTCVHMYAGYVCYAMLDDVMLCYAMLCYVMLLYVMFALKNHPSLQ